MIDYETTPAFLSVTYAPRLLMVLIALVERTSDMVLLSSGMKIFFFWRFALRRFLPVGLNCVARVRLLYPPAILVLFPVTTQLFDIVVSEMVS